MYRIITTVGTSIFTNYGDKKVKEAFDKANETHKSINNNLEKIEDKTPDEIKGDGVAKDIEKIIKGNWVEGIFKKDNDNWEMDFKSKNEDCCAEIKTIVEFCKRVKKNKKNVEFEVYLITTDTATSALAAKIIKDVLGKFNSRIKVADIIIAKGLRTENYLEFENKGINSLFEELTRNIIFAGKYDKNKKFDSARTVINISGGYKAIIPYMTIFAQIYKIETIYIYENSNSLITIPVLPIQIDWGFAEEYYPYLRDPTKVIDDQKHKYLEKLGLLKKNGNRYSWTSLGEFFNNVIEKELHVSKSVMGFFFEYKLYEYYVRNNYKDKDYKEYKVVDHSVMFCENVWDSKENVEIDLLLQTSTEEDFDYVLIEVKSLLKIGNDRPKGYSIYKELKKQIEKHKIAMQNKPKPAKEYHLCLYTPDNTRFNELKPYQIKRIQELSRIFNDTTVEFKAFIIKANYKQMKDNGMRNSNPYQQLMKDKLGYGKNFKEINLGGYNNVK